MPAIPKPKTTLRYTHHPNAAPNAHNSPSSPSDNLAMMTDQRPGNSPYTPAMPYDEPASFPRYPSRLYRPKVGRDGTFSSDWDLRITSFELFIMLLAMLALLIILAWLAVLLVDWLLPRSASRRRAVREVRKLSRALGNWNWEGREGEHHPGIPMHHARGGSERYSDRGRDEEGRVQGQGLSHNLALLGLGGRSRANSVRENENRRGAGDREAYGHHYATQAPGSRRGSGQALDVEKGQGEWTDGGEKVDVRRRSGAV